MTDFSRDPRHRVSAMNYETANGRRFSLATRVPCCRYRGRGEGRGTSGGTWERVFVFYNVSIKVRNTILRARSDTYYGV